MKLNLVNSRAHRACLELRHFYCTEIFQIVIVSPDQEWLFCSFQPVLPLFQHHLDRQEFLVDYIVVPLCMIETMGQQGRGMTLLVLGRLLGHDGPHSNGRSINLSHKLTGRGWMDEDGCCGEPMLQVHIGSVDSWRPCERYFGRGECRAGGRQGTVAPNEAAVEVSEAQETL